MACLSPGPVELVYEQEQVMDDVFEQQPSAMHPKKAHTSHGGRNDVKRSQSISRESGVLWTNVCGFL
ncbi:unnamed protein product [Cuscuta campestris]|uniref:Uncharacterized protein n=1 Tax=Cuscuta campestris TaxID=132261 RepID=A0A484K4N6_9ASTE|nr:unnamed protein product [Cuscuta campestris]